MDGTSKYYSVVTDTGNRLMTAALATKEKLSITEIAVGDGSGAYYQPDPEMTALKNELWRGPINSCEVSSSSDNILVVRGIIPGEVGGFTIREMAVFSEGGEMIAIANTPSVPKVNIVDGIINEMSLAIEIALLNGSVINLLVDPHIVTATKADIEMIKNEIYIALEERVNMVVAHENIPADERKPHTYYLSVTGSERNDVYDVDLQDNMGKSYRPMANPDTVAEFTESASRENINSGDTHRTIFGKLCRLIKDLGTAAYIAIANNCTTTAPGFALDARQGKILMDKTDQLSSDLGGFEFMVNNGVPGFKAGTGAAWVPFGGRRLTIPVSISCDGWRPDPGPLRVNCSQGIQLSTEKNYHTLTISASIFTLKLDNITTSYQPNISIDITGVSAVSLSYSTSAYTGDQCETGKSNNAYIVLE